MIMQLKKKIGCRKGFTLAETLLAVMILLMVSAIVASGIPAAKNAYEKVVLASNAEALMSTTVNALRNELGTAQNIQVSPSTGNATEITYYSSLNETNSKICLKSEAEGAPGTIWLYRYAEVDNIGSNSTGGRLVSESASTTDLYVTYSKVGYSDGVVTIENLSVNRKTGNINLAKRDLSIHVIT